MHQSRSVEEYIEKNAKWSTAIEKLRKILNATELEETLKWGAPCYTKGGKNIVGIGAFKEYVGLWFHQGVFLSDPDHVLVNAQEGKTQALRQWRFTATKDIKSGRIKPYVREAIANHEQGKVRKPVRHKPLALPQELKSALARSEKANRAFSELAKGKQREFADYISEAKRCATKATRLAKILPMIEASIGLNDQYRRK